MSQRSTLKKMRCRYFKRDYKRFVAACLERPLLSSFQKQKRENNVNNQLNQRNQMWLEVAPLLPKNHPGGRTDKEARATWYLMKKIYRNAILRYKKKGIIQEENWIFRSFEAHFGMAAELGFLADSTWYNSMDDTSGKYSFTFKVKCIDYFSYYF